MIYICRCEWNRNADLDGTVTAEETFRYLSAVANHEVELIFMPYPTRADYFLTGVSLTPEMHEYIRKIRRHKRGELDKRLAELRGNF